jgi:hypothetical protein
MCTHTLSYTHSTARYRDIVRTYMHIHRLDLQNMCQDNPAPDVVQTEQCRYCPKSYINIYILPKSVLFYIEDLLMVSMPCRTPQILILCKHIAVSHLLPLSLKSLCFILRNGVVLLTLCRYACHMIIFSSNLNQIWYTVSYQFQNQSSSESHTRMGVYMCVCMIYQCKYCN